MEELSAELLEELQSRTDASRSLADLKANLENILESLNVLGSETSPETDPEKTVRQLNVSNFVIYFEHNVSFNLLFHFLLMLIKLSLVFQGLKKSLAQIGENANKIGGKLKERYAEKQVPLPTDLAKQLSHIKVCII